MRILTPLKRKLGLDMSGLGPTDLVLASFPKSGNTWVRFMLTYLSLALEGNTKQIVNAFNITNFSPELPGRIGVNSTGGSFPRVVKTHLPYHPRFPKVLLIVRDPVSVMRSYFMYAKAREIVSEDMTPWQFIKDERIGIKAWEKHTLSYLNTSAIGFRIQVVKFEEIKNDPSLFIHHVARLLGFQLIDDIVYSVVKLTTIAALKENEDYLVKGLLAKNGFEFFGGTKKSGFNFDGDQIDYIKERTQFVTNKLSTISMRG